MFFQNKRRFLTNTIFYAHLDKTTKQCRAEVQQHIHHISHIARSTWRQRPRRSVPISSLAAETATATRVRSRTRRPAKTRTAQNFRRRQVRPVPFPRRCRLCASQARTVICRQTTCVTQTILGLHRLRQTCWWPMRQLQTRPHMALLAAARLLAPLAKAERARDNTAVGACWHARNISRNGA